MEDNSKFIAKRTFRKFFLPSILSLLTTTLLYIGNLALISWQLGTDTMAMYMLTLPLWLIFDVIFKSAGSATIKAFTDAISENDKLKAIDRVSRLFMATIIITLVAIVLCEYFTRQLIYIFGFTSEMEAAASEFIKILLPSLLIFYIPTFLRYILVADGRQVSVLIRNIIMTIVNLGLLYLFLWKLDLGINGVAIALAAAGVIGTILSSAHFISKNYFIRIRFRIPRMSDFRSIFTFSRFYCIDYIATAVVMVFINKHLITNFPIETVSIFLLTTSLVVYLTNPIGQSLYATALPLISTFNSQQSNNGVIESYKLTVNHGIGLGVILAIFGIIIAPYVPTLLGYEYISYTETAIFATRLFAIGIPFIIIVNVSKELLNNFDKRQIAIAISLMVNIIFPTLIICLYSKTLNTTLLWMLYGLSSVATILIMGTWIKIKHNGLFALLNKHRLNFRSQIHYLLKTDEIENVLHYQEMIQLYLNAHNIDPKKTEYVTLAIGEIVEYAIASEQRTKSYIDLQIAILENDDVRIMVKLDNKIINLNSINHNIDDKFTSLRILRQVSKKFTFNHILAFNSLDITL